MQYASINDHLIHGLYNITEWMPCFACYGIKQLKFHLKQKVIFTYSSKQLAYGNSV